MGVRRGGLVTVIRTSLFVLDSAAIEGRKPENHPWRVARAESAVSLGITRSDFGDVTVLVLDGNVTLGANHVFLREQIFGMLEDGRRKFILDYSAVQFQDSAGNGALAASWAKVRNSGGELVLAGLQHRMIDMFQVTKLNAVFKIFATANDALDHFGVDAKG
jgi:anti-sigma B factor antagonist